VAEFLAFTHKAPWEMQVEDVEAYVESLKEGGLRAGTILGRLAALSKFYEHCQAQGSTGERRVSTRRKPAGHRAAL
jgi:site-specific recombinase XerD